MARSQGTGMPVTDDTNRAIYKYRLLAAVD